MQTRVQKWGNSLALRIPKAFAEQLQMAPDTAVELLLVEGRLVIRPLTAPVYNLHDLLEGMNPDTLHGEVDSGAAVGVEAW